MPKQKATKVKLLIEDDKCENVVISIPDFQLEKNCEYLSSYLETIKGKARDYKRVTTSPLRYAGGKAMQWVLF